MTTPLTTAPLDAPLAALPKAELHLHLEGAIEPATVAELAARHGETVTAQEAKSKYEYQDFLGFLEAFKWVASYLRQPADYRLITDRLAERLLEQNVVYAEVMLSIGVMLRQRQDVEANYKAIREAGERAGKRGLRLQWVFDAARQFGAQEAMEVARHAARMKGDGVIAFGMGGDELAFPASDFQKVYDFARAEGLHTLVHAGEVGGPKEIFDALEPLGVERIGHGIAAMRDVGLMEWLAAWRVPLEICPTSNMRTGALAGQLKKDSATIEEHPLRTFLDRNIRVALSTDDPAMFHTTLNTEYALAAQMGMTPIQVARLAEMSFEAAFLPDAEKEHLLQQFRAKRDALGLV